VSKKSIHFFTTVFKRLENSPTNFTRSRRQLLLRSGYLRQSWHSARRTGSLWPTSPFSVAIDSCRLESLSPTHQYSLPLDQCVGRDWTFAFLASATLSCILDISCFPYPIIVLDVFMLCKTIPNSKLTILCTLY